MFLVDTSIWIHALRPRGNRNIQEKLRPLILARQAALTEWIVLELMTGIRSTEEYKALSTFLAPVPRLPINLTCWESAYKLVADLRKKGTTPSAADSIIAAVSIHHEVPLIHLDEDFVRMVPHTKLEEIDWSGYL